jgi:hypothetical protein
MTKRTPGLFEDFRRPQRRSTIKDDYMKNQDKATTALVRSMKRTLEQQHGIKVPHAALRASYLQALGENPHAFAGRSTAEVTAALPETDDTTTLRVLYLVEDDIGCLERLALTADGCGRLPEEFQFHGAKLMSQVAELPRVSKYGLPDYLVEATKFYGAFGLELDPAYVHTYKDLGDDSGDSCRAVIKVSLTEWMKVVAAALENDQGFVDTVSEWVGLHYRAVFETESSEKKFDWVHRYLETLALSDLMDDAASSAQGADTEVIFEYVYPDEDGDTVAASVNIQTGIVSFTQALPADVHSPEVRTRIWVTDDGEPLESAGDGTLFEAEFDRQWPAAGNWRVHNLQELQQHFARFVKN